MINDTSLAFLTGVRVRLEGGRPRRSAQRRLRAGPVRRTSAHAARHEGGEELVANAVRNSAVRR